jgi:hypothetical protein
MIQTKNLVMGPARIYWAPTGTAEPADATVTDDGWLTPPPSPWMDLGGTDGGINLEIDTTYTAKKVDQIIMDVGATLTDLKMQVAAPLAEISDQNLAVALNNIVESGAGEGFLTMEILDGTYATQSKYSALILDGWGPELDNGAPTLRRAIVRKVLSTAKVQLQNDRKTQQKIDTTWAAYFVGEGIRPIRFVTATA